MVTDKGKRNGELPEQLFMPHHSIVEEVKRPHHLLRCQSGPARLPTILHSSDRVPALDHGIDTVETAETL